MMDAVRDSIEERDLLLFVIDATEPFGEEDKRALSILRAGRPAGDRRVQQDRRAAGEARSAAAARRVSEAL